MSTADQSFIRDLERLPRAATPSIVLASLLSNVLGVALPVAILIVYDRVLPNASEHTLTLLTLGVLGAVFIDMLVRIARGMIVSHRANRFGHRAYLGAIERVIACDPRDFQSVSTAEHLDRLNAVDTIRDVRGSYLPQLLVDFPFFVIFLGLVFAIGGMVGLVLIGFVILASGVALWTGLMVRNRLESRQRNATAQTNFLIETLRGLPTIKSYSMESLMQRRFERVMETSAAVTASLTNGSISAQAITNLVTQGAQISVVAAGSLLVIAGDMTIGGIAACMLLTGRALQPLNRAAMLWSQHQSVRIAKQRIRDLRDMPLIRQTGSVVRERLTGEIELREIRFGYTEGQPLFAHLNLRIEPGDCALVTSAGNQDGKSTLLSLIGNVLTPDEGLVLYDDTDSRTFDNEWLRSRIAFLPQTPALFEGTIFENLTGFDPTPAHIERVEEVAGELGLTQVVSKLPLGFQTEIRASGTESLPASVRQQIPIVRALARDPDIIIMDECNSNLDREADQQFRRSLESRKANTTIIMATPRPSFQALADREIILNETLMTRPETDADPVTEMPATTAGGLE